MLSKELKCLVFLTSLISLPLTCCLEQANKEIICNKPYIRFGSDCCLDKNDNLICDTDEKPADVQTRPQEVSTKPPASTERTDNKIVSDTPSNPQGRAVKRGDIVSIDYITWLDTGQLLGTNIKPYAELARIYVPGDDLTYEPATFVVGNGEMSIDNEVIGMRLGEVKNISIPKGSMKVEKYKDNSATCQVKILNIADPVPVILITNRSCKTCRDYTTEVTKALNRTFKAVAYTEIDYNAPEGKKYLSGQSLRKFPGVLFMRNVTQEMFYPKINECLEKEDAYYSLDIEKFLNSNC